MAAAVHHITSICIVHEANAKTVVVYIARAIAEQIRHTRELLAVI